MATKDFRTKTIFRARENITKNEKYWPIALDIGYSGVKGFAPNHVFCFPFYSKKLNKTDITLGNPTDKDILYRDCETGDVYVVGAKAQNELSYRDTKDTNLTLYGRNRYYTSNFIVCSQVGLGLATLKNKYGDPKDKKIVLQTGLPPLYLAEDTEPLKDVLCRRHQFDLKIGKNDWKHFDIDLSEEDVLVTQQPLGTLTSVITKNDGSYTFDAKDILASGSLVVDPGFGTFDTSFILQNRLAVENCLTISQFAMNQLLQNTCDRLKAEHEVNMTVPAMQSKLETGQVKVTNRQLRRSFFVDIEPILREESEKTCLGALDHLASVYDDFGQVSYIILAGGLSSAWYPIVKDYFKYMETITILQGTRNDDLEFIFTNVRGYYMALVNKLK